MSILEEESDQIAVIKNHLKEVALYYQESFFEKNQIEGLSMEEILPVMAQQIQHNEQTITSVMDLVGLLILKCECLFRMQEENEQQIEDTTNKFVQQLEFERMSTQQYEILYREQQDKANNLINSMTDIENSFIDSQGQKQVLQDQFKLIQSDNNQKQVEFIIYLQLDKQVSEQLQKEYESYLNNLKQKNQSQACTIEIFENAVEQFGILKTELNDQIFKLTDELNQQKSTNRFLNKSNDALSEEIQSIQAAFATKIQSMQTQAPQRTQRPSFLIAPGAKLNFNKRPSLLAINAYSQKLSKDINIHIPLSLKSELQNHFLPETEGTALDFSGQKRQSILPAILAQQLQTLNPQIIANAYLENNNSIVSESSEISDLDSSRMSSQSIQSKSTPYRRSKQIFAETLVQKQDNIDESTSQSPKPLKEEQLESDKKQSSVTKPKTLSIYSQQTLVAQQKVEQLLELIPRTRSTFQGKTPAKQVIEKNRASSFKKPPTMRTQSNFQKKSTDNTNETSKTRMDPYKEFFVLTSQCAKLNSADFDKILKIEPQPLYDMAISQKIPFNKWYIFIKNELERKKVNF